MREFDKEMIGDLYRSPKSATQALWNLARMWQGEQRPYWKRIREELLDSELQGFIDKER